MLSRRRFTLLTAAAAAAPALAPPAADTGASLQLRWLLAASRRLPVPADELRTHFTAELLAAAGGTDGLNTTLASLGPQRLVRLVIETPDTAQAVTRGPIATMVTTLRTEGSGLIAGLVSRPSPAVSWPEVERRLRRLAPGVSFAASRFGPEGRQHTLHAIAPDTARPLGSAFKLYVLGALARAVDDRRVGWDQPLAIRDDWKSLPSGVLQDLPAGTTVPIHEYADKMISISDNTATDHLIHTLGRSTVHAELARMGNHQVAANTPFLTTRELFLLKWYRYPQVAREYLARPPARREAILERLGAVPLDRIEFVKEPRLGDRIEWFGSAHDMVRAYASLWQRRDTPVGTALSMNDAGIGLDRSRYPTVWYKGGSEPGVLTLNFLAADTAGQVAVVSALLHDPKRAFAEVPVTFEALGAVAGALQLALS